LPLPAEAFYHSDLPTSLQQGDIADGVPLILLPPAEALVIVRSPHRKFFKEHLDPGEATLVDERALNDAFDQGPEYAAVSVIRGMAMILTPTCDIPGNDSLSVWPIRPIEGSDLDEGNLNAGKYANLVRLPDHKYFDGAFIDLTDIRSVRPSHFPLKNRIASVTREAQNEIVERFQGAYGRVWGYETGETIEPLGRNETGTFRCARCNQFDGITVPQIPLKPGASAPDCDNCRKIGKRPQWYPLIKHKKS
jgi:hypothetical protein